MGTLNNQNNDFYQGYNSEYSYNDDFKSINLGEFLLVIFCIIALLFSLFLGFYNQNYINKDNQKKFDINQVLKALESYYISSNTVPSLRYYPQSLCSEKLNEVDYDYTLRIYLTGLDITLEPNTYIFPDKWPFDKSGKYATYLKDRKIPLKSCDRVYKNLQNLDNRIYDFGNSCQFNITNKDYRNCYLYSGYSGGEKFELAYFSESKNVLVVYSRFRDGILKIENIPV